MDRELAKKATVLFCIFLMFVGVVYASYVIYSNTVTVTLFDYSLVLSEVHDGLEINLTATLKYPNGTPVVGKDIEFWNCSDPLSPETTLDYRFGTVATNEYGNATLTVYGKTGVTQHYVVRCQVP